MNNSDRARIILNIEIAANWLNTIPHDINAIVAEKHRQARAQASIRSGSDGRAPKVDGPDLKGLYEAQAVRTRAAFADQHAAPRGDHRAGLAAARIAARTGAE